ncbi:MAG: hypothetical protein IPM93_09280 [Candidatus Obscuribacter sp.]|nr:hypothetical protein [Candidatus Obscuribacter sp.]
MTAELPKTCYLCDKTLRYNYKNKAAVTQGLPLTEDTHDLDAKSEAHYGHNGNKGTRKEFERLSDAAWKAMGVSQKTGSKIMCYECHEVILHNPVLSETQIEKLRVLFRGKSFEARVIQLNQVISAGLEKLLDSQIPIRQIDF